MSNLSLEPIGGVDVGDPFFDSLRADYPGFDGWLARKASESAYIARRDTGGPLDGFLYLKVEHGGVEDVQPPLAPAARLKIGTMKVNPHGTRLGERLIKKVFDHAVAADVDEVYVTVFPKHARLIDLLARYGFAKVGVKVGPGGTEDVMSRSMRRIAGDVALDYPMLDVRARAFMLGILPAWHTRLLPDSILRGESPMLVEDVSHTNSIHKVYLTAMRGTERLARGDLLAIYRTTDGAGPARFRSVVTSLCVVEEVRDLGSFRDADDLIAYCAPYSVFENDELRAFWRTKKYPTVIRFTYNVALKKRLTRGDLIDHGVIDESAYAGFASLSSEGLRTIIERGGVSARLVVDQA